MCPLKVFVCAIILVQSRAELPFSITPCSRSLSLEELSNCMVNEAKKAQAKFIKGNPELGIESADPLLLDDVINIQTGTFKVRNKNVILKGLKNAEVKEIVWDLKTNTGRTKILGNLTFISDYEVDGRVLLIPVSGKGKMTVKTYNTEILIKYKLRKIKDQNDVEHIETYDIKTSQNIDDMKIHLSDLLGNKVLGDTINQVINQNWRELNSEVGPQYVLAVSKKMHKLTNKLYRSVPYDELLAP